MWKAGWTLEKVLMKQKRVCEGDKETREAVDQFIDLVWRLTDLDLLSDVTIHSRRQEHLLKPMLFALKLLLDPQIPIAELLVAESKSPFFAQKLT